MSTDWWHTETQFQVTQQIYDLLVGGRGGVPKQNQKIADLNQQNAMVRNLANN